jgi:hypothetical protein
MRFPFDVNTKRYISIFRISVLLTLSADNTALILVLSTELQN